MDFSQDDVIALSDDEPQTEEPKEPSNPQRIRITLRQKHPNPLFVKWLEEFLAEAENKNYNSRFRFRKALSSLLLYPLPLTSGRDCIILDGFGRKICDMLDQKLRAYVESNTDEIIPPHENVKESHLKKLPQAKRNQQILKETLRKSLALPDRRESFEMLPGQYEIILLVDTQETLGKSKAHLDKTLQELQRLNVQHEVKRISVGDFLWIARDKNGNELVLPYILERKRMDDLASSIKDGRFHEQKYRLKNCGLKNVIYLIESVEGGEKQNLGLPLQNLQQAIANTQVQNGFQIKMAKNNKQAVLYLHVLTGYIKKFYAEKTLAMQDEVNKDEIGGKEYLQDFESFNRTFTKSHGISTKDIFIKQLVTLKGLSVEKALAITDMFSTPRALFSAFDRCPPAVGLEMLASIRYGPTKRAIGSNISRTLYKLYVNKKAS